MKNLLLTCISVFFASISFAQIDGPFSGGSLTTVAIPGSNKTWTNPGNASPSDNVYSTFGNLTGGVGSYTDYLVATNFGFALPSGIVITGIVVEVERADPSFRTSDYQIRIVKGGVIGTTERSGGAGYSSTDSYQLYGNPGDLWGDSWTETDINAANFGVAISAQRSNPGSTTANARVDDIRVTVFWEFLTLPVKLIKISAGKNKNNVELKWTTAEEFDMRHYEIERSSNARDFVAIEKIACQNKWGQNSYVTKDDNPVNGFNFYRLKMVELNGDVNYSRIVFVIFSTGENVLVYPNPWKKGLPLQITNPENEKLEIIFYNSSGQLVARVFTNSSRVPTEALNNSKGILFFRIQRENGEATGSGRLVVN